MRTFFNHSGRFMIIALLGMPALSLGDSADSDTQPVETVGSDRYLDMSLDDIGIELINPVTSLLSVRTDYNYVDYQGDLEDAGDVTAGILNVETVFPIHLRNGKNLMLRLNIPINGDQPIYGLPDNNTAALGLSPFLIRQNASTIPDGGTFDNELGHDHLADVTFDVAYGGVSESGFITMYGLAGQLPTSQDLSQSTDQFLLGPEIAMGKKTDWGIYGAWLQHLTRISGESAWDTNMTSLKFFFAYGLGNGWQIISNPVLAYDWEAESDQKLFLPIGAGVAKTTHLGRFPFRMSFEIQKYIVSPDAIGPDWLFTFSATPAFRN